MGTRRVTAGGTQAEYQVSTPARRVTAAGLLTEYEITNPVRRVSALGLMVEYAARPYMTIEEGLWWFLTRDAGDVQARVLQRVYPTQAPQTVTDYPIIVYQRVSGPRLSAHDGATTFATARFQLTMTGQTYAEAKTLADRVRKAAQGYRGLWGASASLGGIFVHECEVDNELDGWGQTGQLYTVRMDLVVHYREQ